MTPAVRDGDIPGIQLRAHRRLPVSAAEAWRWLTERERLERWLADRVEVDPGPGGGIRLERDAGPGSSPLVEVGQTESIGPGRSWVLRFRREDPRWEASTRLEIQVLDAVDGCELDVLQLGFHQLALSACLTIWEEYRRRWRDALARLELQLTVAAPDARTRS